MHTVLRDYSELSAFEHEQLLALEVSAEQLAFSGDIYSALYTLSSGNPDEMRGLVLLADGVPRGFFLLKRGIYLPAWADPRACTLHALQVDQRVQRQGLGRACLSGLPEAVRQRWPDRRYVQLSVDAHNEAGLGLYRALGWVDTGEAYRGRIGFERRLTLTL